jgi:hypothetical protein
MSSLITLLCIFGLSLFMYAYISMYNLNKDYPTKCSVIYISRSEDINREVSPHMEVLEHERHDSKFRHSSYDTAPRGISELDDLLSSNNNML